jgi:hypothetical protein
MRRAVVFGSIAIMALACAIAVRADEEEEMIFPEGQVISRAVRLRTSQDGIDPDTVWIGHIADPGWRPRDRFGNIMSAASFPTIATGGYGPYHVGRGNNRPGIGPGTSYNAVWDWDHLQPGESDSLMGWWPIARAYQSAGNVQPDDKLRPFFGLDYGNLGNYVINQGQKRTLGVTGYWHRDVGRNSQPLPDTGSAVPGPNVEWKPITGGASAWCGLRAHGDMTHLDPITGNPYNQSILGCPGNNAGFPTGSLSGLGTDANYPGYGSQWIRCSTRTWSYAAMPLSGVLRVRHSHVPFQAHPRDPADRLLLQIRPRVPRRERQLHRATDAQACQNGASRFAHGVPRTPVGGRAAGTPTARP